MLSISTNSIYFTINDFSTRRSNFTRRIQKLQEEANGPPTVWGGPWTLGSRVPIGWQGWKRDHWLVGISKLPNESETRHAGSGREEYRILTNKSKWNNPHTCIIINIMYSLFTLNVVLSPSCTKNIRIRYRYMNQILRGKKKNHHIEIAQC